MPVTKPISEIRQIIHTTEKQTNDSDMIYLKSGSLTSTGLLLDWHNLENFIFQCARWQEEVNDITLLAKIFKKAFNKYTNPYIKLENQSKKY